MNIRTTSTTSTRTSPTASGRAGRPNVVRLGAVVAAAGLVTLGVAAPAAAHVSVTATDTGAGAYTVLTFSVPHGCDGSPTTELAISIPEGVNAVTPTRNPYYDLAERTEQLDPPVQDSHGNEVTERTSVVTYTAETPLPDGQRDTLELSLQLPDAAGDTLAFPVIQTCEQGETAWTEVAAEGAESDSLDSPAPVVTITEAGADAHGHGDEAAAEADETAAEQPAVTSTDSLEPVAATSDDSGNGLAIAGLVAGILGLLAGGAALARSGRRA